MSHEAHEVIDGICRPVLVLSELEDGGAVVRSAEPGAKVEAHEAGAGRWHSLEDCRKVKHYGPPDSAENWKPSLAPASLSVNPGSVPAPELPKPAPRMVTHSEPPAKPAAKKASEKKR